MKIQYMANVWCFITISEGPAFVFTTHALKSSLIEWWYGASFVKWGGGGWVSKRGENVTPASGVRHGTTVPVLPPRVFRSWCSVPIYRRATPFSAFFLLTQPDKLSASDVDQSRRSVSFVPLFAYMRSCISGPRRLSVLLVIRLLIVLLVNSFRIPSLQ